MQSMDNIPTICRFVGRFWEQNMSEKFISPNKNVTLKPQKKVIIFFFQVKMTKVYVLKG